VQCIWQLLHLRTLANYSRVSEIEFINSSKDSEAIQRSIGILSFPENLGSSSDPNIVEAREAHPAQDPTVCSVLDKWNYERPAFPALGMKLFAISKQIVQV